MSTAAPPEDSTRFDLRAALLSMPAWGVSLVIHIALMSVLLLVPVVATVPQVTNLLSAIDEDIVEDFDVNVDDQMGTMGDSLNYVASPAPSAALQAEQKTPQQDIEKFEDAEIAVVDHGFDVPSQGEITGSVDTTGTGTENVGGTEGAIDRIAMELATSLRERRTLAIWLFDSSLSLRDRRNTIADRFEMVYKQLDQMEANKNAALTTAVATFDKGFKLLTKEPVSDVKTLIPMVRSIKSEAGDENVFGAVLQLTNQFQKYRTKNGTQNVMIFIITDERGEDQQLAEDAILKARRAGIRVYCIGNASLFGRSEAFLNFKYDESQPAREFVIDGGPETVAPENVILNFWGVEDRTLTRMSSGFGPYALTRLCKESGGLFFIADDTASHKFPPEVMRAYQPDYRPVRDYEAALKKSPAKAALVLAAGKTTLENVPLPNLVFRADTNNVLLEGLAVAQRPAAEFDAKLSILYGILATGEKDRPKVKEARWRAGYDLAMGRVLAMRVRFYGYNKMLAEMRQLPKTFTKKDSNEWRLAPSKQIQSGADVKKMEKAASDYLKRVIDEHADTPWALMAAKELATPMGWEWREARGNYENDQTLSPEERAKQKRFAEEQKKKEAAKPKMAGPPIPAKI